jgi:hypothetical protein
MASSAVSLLVKATPNVSKASGNDGGEFSLEDIDEDLRPPPEAGGNGNGLEGGAAKQERVNAKRRAAYAKSKEQT